MKLQLAVAITLLWVVATAAQRDDTEELKGALENIDIDSLLQNRRYVETQIKCVRHTGKCDKTGRHIKALLPEVLQRNCDSCTEKQRVNINRIIEHVKINYSSDWILIEEEYSRA